jgi:hypothetical protein
MCVLCVHAGCFWVFWGFVFLQVPSLGGGGLLRSLCGGGVFTMLLTGGSILVGIPLTSVGICMFLEPFGMFSRIY